jgi:hypothetical protein
MPYSDRWGLTANKVTGGTYTVQHPDSPLSPVTVRVDQELASDPINAAGALFRAIQILFPGLPAPWANRYAYAVAQWKLAAYQNLISGASGSTRTQLTAKRNRWVTEESRLKTLMGSDA